ncbi:MAG: N-acetylmuramate/N-acetylglucosamine kinase [Myxococcota bacterium]|nr:N-acetylmuramate/N-acetylglucosamine kinase [Myxococcota bacterium]
MGPLLDMVAPALREITGLKKPEIELVKLKGDASTRSYYRALVGAKGKPGQSYVVMVLPGDAAKSEEASKGKAPKELPFLNVHRYLKSKDLPVPEIHHEAIKEGFLILEDLGDETMERWLLSHKPDEWAEAYARAVDLLVDMQAATEDAAKSSCVAKTRSFDNELLMWECDHFIEFGIEARRNSKLSRPIRAEMSRNFDLLVKELLKIPTHFVHRDYQSRNLMFQKDRVVLIDFQDALMGPIVYDLVALLRDSYVDLPNSLVEQMIKRYAARANERGLLPKGTTDARVKEWFDLQTLQRKLKDAGRFVYIDRVKKNPDFLPYVPNSLKFVREAFRRRPEWEGLRRKLAPYVNELA